MSERERGIVREKQPIGMEGFNRLFYADDTPILTKVPLPLNFLFHTTQESSKYNMRLNQSKCLLLKMNSLQGVYYEDGGAYA